MKKKNTRTLTSLILLSALAGAFNLKAQTSAFMYQGRLNDGGNPANGTYDFQFALFDASTGGNQIGVLTNAATAVSNGLFTVALDFGPGAFPGAGRWLEMGVVTNGGEAFTILTPRQQITATPYAIQAASAATAATAGSVSAANIAGTLTGTQLPGNVAFLDANNEFTQVNGLKDVDLQFRGVADGNHGVGWYGGSKPFGSFYPDGPVLFGFGGGGLGTASGGRQIALSWNSAGNVGIGTGTPSSRLQVNGTVTASGFSGNGSGLTSLSAANLTGTISLPQLPPQVMTTGGTFSGAGLTNLNLLLANSQGAIGWMTNWTTNVAAGKFTIASSSAVGLGPSALVYADVNGDGRPDLITANDQANTLSVLTNNGSGGFVLSSSPAVGTDPLEVVAADVNGDGKVDLISANYYSSSLTVLTNNGTGGFALMATLNVNAYPNSIATADVNGDGKVDLIVANDGDTKVSVLLNTGNGFVLSSTPTVSLGANWVTAADVDGDGHVDLICANAWYNRVTILLNNGSGGFSAAHFPQTGNEPFFVAAADVNGDGKVDLITANWADNTVSVLLNNGSGIFSLASSPAVGANPNWVTAADVNGDGKLDLISANYSSTTLTVLTNIGNGSFANFSTLNVGTQPYAVVAADFNGDGRMDLASANPNASTVSVLVNGPDLTTNFNANFAGSYSGNGSGLTGLAASNLTGTIALAQLPAAVLTNNSTGVALTGSFSGNGASLTALNAGNIATGTLADARLSANVALLNGNQSFAGSNIFGGVTLLTNANNTLVGTHAGNGAALTSLNAANISSGTLADVRLSSNVALLGANQSFSGSNNFSGPMLLTNPNNNLMGNGASITGLNAGNIASGTIAEARLSANVALLNANNQFTGTNGLNDRDLRLRTGTDGNHGLGWYGSTKPFAGTFTPDGPILFGFSAGGLGTTINTQKLALVWNSAGRVGIDNSNPTSELDVSGTITAIALKGDGSGLTNLNASQITSGTVPLAQLPFAVVTNGETGLTLSGVFSGTGASLSGIFSGNGAGLTNLTATNLNGALAPNTLVKFVGDRTNGFANAVVYMQNTNASLNAAPALRVQNDGGNTPFGALSASANVSSTASNSVIAQFGNASAWVLTITNDGTIYCAGDVYARGVKLTSDRNAKEKFTAVDSKSVLEKVAALPMSEWDYKNAPGVRHLGPVAQDFHAAFGLNGSDDTHISVVDEGGVALAAIQGLNEKLEAKAQNSELSLQRLEAENAELRSQLDELRSVVQAMNQKPHGGAK